MIKAVMVINTLGKPRLSKFYDFQCVEKQHQLIRHIYAILSSRPQNVSNFVEVQSIFGPDTRLVYKHYATLYFVIVFDNSENELAMLDLIQVFVETVDKCFRNVCELDILFNYNKIDSAVGTCSTVILKLTFMSLLHFQLRMGTYLDTIGALGSRASFPACQFALLFQYLPLMNVALSFEYTLQIQSILDEIVFGGQVLETNSMEVIKAAEEISRS